MATGKPLEDSLENLHDFPEILEKIRQIGGRPLSEPSLGGSHRIDVQIDLLLSATASGHP